jgi:hypothetical protein
MLTLLILISIISQRFIQTSITQINNPLNPLLTNISLQLPRMLRPQQPIENILSPLGSLNMTSIHPSNSEVLSFGIPGFKIIVIPISSQQQDHTYSNYSSDNQFTQFTPYYINKYYNRQNIYLNITALYKLMSAILFRNLFYKYEIN